MKLTKNFSNHEFTVSTDFPKLANKIEISEHGNNKLKLLSESLLQPIRDEWSDKSESITILSGIRSKELNTAIKGSSDSDHLYGIACDWTSKNLLAKFMWSFYLSLPYSQLIYYPDQHFIHCSINIPGRSFKHQSLVKYESTTKYLTQVCHKTSDLVLSN